MTFKPGHQALRRGRVSISNQIYLVTSTTEDRKPFFSDFQVATAASICFEKAQLLNGSQMLSWVLMPDHAHWLIQLGEKLELSELIKRIKSASAFEANKSLNGQGPIWSRGFHDRALRREEDVLNAARYLVANPLRAGLVKKIGDYPYWNAVWL